MNGTPTGKFPKTAHLLKRADFQRVYQQGRRHFSGNMTVFYLEQRSSGQAGRTAAVPRSPEAVEGETAAPTCVRVGFTVPKALGKSVDRNRIRRRLREAVRHHLGEMGEAKGIDIVINPKRSAIEADFVALSKEVERAFEVIRKNPQAGSAKKSERAR